MTSNPASQRTRKGMIVNINGVTYPCDFQDGDKLMYDVVVSLPRLDEDGKIITKVVKKTNRVKQDGCSEINVDETKKS